MTKTKANGAPVLPDKAQLLNAAELLARLFTPTTRPSTRTLIRWRQSRKIPFVQIGRRIWYQEDKVRQAIERKNLVRAV